VAPNGGLPISYNGATNSCALVCHETVHNPNGTVAPLMLRNGYGIKK